MLALILPLRLYCQHATPLFRCLICLMPTLDARRCRVYADTLLIRWLYADNIEMIHVTLSFFFFLSFLRPHALLLRVVYISYFAMFFANAFSLACRQPLSTAAPLFSLFRRFFARHFSPFFIFHPCRYAFRNVCRPPSLPYVMFFAIICSLLPLFAVVHAMFSL